jgi:hypothetical protein
MVKAQNAGRAALSKVNSFSVKVMVRPMWTNTGMFSTTKHTTATKQLDKVFKENVFFISSDIPLFLRLFLATANNLQFMNNIGGMIIIINIRRAT